MNNLIYDCYKKKIFSSVSWEYFLERVFSGIEYEHRSEVKIYAKIGKIKGSFGLSLFLLKLKIETENTVAKYSLRPTLFVLYSILGCPKILSYF